MPPPPSSGGMLSADMFGAPEPSEAASASAPDDFGGFGGQSLAAGSVDAVGLDFGSFGSTAGAPLPGTDDDFGDFGGLNSTCSGGSCQPSAVRPDGTAIHLGPGPSGGSVGTTPAAAAALDLFAGFESEVKQSAPSAARFNPSDLFGSPLGSRGILEDDDSLGHVAVITPAVVLGAPDTTTAAAIVRDVSSNPSTNANAGTSLQGLLQALVTSERLEEAASCKAHIESIANLAVKQAAYEKAKEEDDLETAIHLKNVVLPTLRRAQQPDDVIAAWSAPSPTALTLAQMARKASDALGADAAPFIARCCDRDLRALSATALPEAARLHATASSTLQLLLELSPSQQEVHLRQLDELLKALLEKLKVAATALQTSRPDGVSDREHATALSSPKVTALLSALSELQRVGNRLACSREWHASVFVPSAAAALGGRVVPATEVRAEISRLVTASFLAAGKPDDAVARPELEDGGARYWACGLPLNERCALSLLPLGSKTYPELPPSIEWQGRHFHAPCANLWAHAVRNAPPS